MQHLSARLVWHDSGWDGRVCSDPTDNSSCIIHEHIRENRDDDFEEKHSGQLINDLDVSEIPPCARDPGAFSPHGSHILHEDPLERPELKPVHEKLPPYSFCTCPYDEMMSDDPNRTWEGDPEVQEERLASFFDELEPDGSLVFVYLKDAHPLADDGRRVVAGVSRISNIGKQVYFRDSDYPVWSRTVTHNFSEEGVLLPYHEYLEQGYQTDSIRCEVPSEHTDSFSYVASHVPDDIAIELLTRIKEVLEEVQRQGKVEGEWDEKIALVDEYITEVWGERGMHPGISGMINHLDQTDSEEMGELFERRVQSKLIEQGKNPLEYVEEILAGERNPPEFFNPGILAYMRKMWSEYSADPKDLLRTLTAFDLTGDQVSDIMWTVRNGDAFTIDDLKENIYILAEPRGYKSTEEIPFDVIDRGAAPDIDRLQDYDPSDNPGFMELHLPEDEGRVRALLANVLESAADRGDTILTISEAVDRANREQTGDKSISITSDFILDREVFFDGVLNVHSDLDPASISLPKYRDMDKEIEETVSTLAASRISTDEADWRAILDRVLQEAGTEELGEEIEQTARQEKTRALNIIQNTRISVLKGSAGTGKTTVVESLLEGLDAIEGGRDRLLLAPTGKARVRLEEVAKTDAKTIHQHLYEHGWLDPDQDFKFKRDGDQSGAHTVIIDEASMVATDLLAYLFRSLDLNKVRRLVLIGDPNQLPPIGPGRPFFDIIHWLEDEHPDHVAELRQQVRQTEGNARELAEVYAEENEEVNDEILAKVSNQDVGGDLEVRFWDRPAELRDAVEDTLNEEFTKYEASDPIDAFEKSIGYKSGAGDAESWQILAPTRIREHGTHAINRQIQDQYRGNLIRDDNVQSFGDEQLVEGDKVIQTVNERRSNSVTETYVANGEIGHINDVPNLADYEYYNRPEYAAEVTFTTQDMPLRYDRGDIREGKLELAYGLTVHKAQGSEFDTTILVLPQEAPTLSRELLYTALTRYKERMVLLIEKDPSTLLDLRKLRYSEIRKRSTYVFEPFVRTTAISHDDDEPDVFYPESLIHKTVNDELVRSKSEVIIANTLDQLGISYDYEQQLEAENNPSDFKIPDFTVSYEGRTYYWEHLGMLHDESYRERWENKQEWYEDNGYDDQLIVTRDDREGGIDAKWIKNKAEKEIIGL